MTDPLSTCCGALVRVAGERTTHWYVCSCCGQPCDVQSNPRPVVVFGLTWMLGILAATVWLTQ